MRDEHARYTWVDWAIVLMAGAALGGVIGLGLIARWQ